MHRPAVVVLLCLAVAGCGGVRTGTFEAAPEEPAGGYARLPAAMPAIEAWYADNGTYGGVTLANLRSRYDASLHGVRVMTADDRSYCVETVQDRVTMSLTGPAGHVVIRPC